VVVRVAMKPAVFMRGFSRISHQRGLFRGRRSIGPRSNAAVASPALAMPRLTGLNAHRQCASIPVTRTRATRNLSGIRRDGLLSWSPPRGW
jgi:hypothetical protein